MMRITTYIKMGAKGSFGTTFRVFWAGLFLVSLAVVLGCGGEGPRELTITTQAFPPAAVGSYYQETLLASGGSPPYTWTLVAGSLPPGLTLDPSGTLSGTPTETGYFLFVLRVTDSSVRLDEADSAFYILVTLGRPIFIVNGLAETLSVYDRGDGSIHQNVATIGRWPNFMAIRAELGYVINSGDNNVQILNLNDLSLLGAISLGTGNNPMQIAFLGQRGYVSNLVLNTVSVIDLSAQEVLAIIPVGNGPTPIAAAGGKVFVGNTNLDWQTFTYGQGTVSVINPATNEVMNTINVGTNPQAMAVDTQGRLHVVCTGDYGSITGEISVIDPATEQTVGEPLAIGGSPGSVSIAADGTAYLISTSFADPLLRGLMAYDSQTMEVIHSAPNLVHISTNPFGVLAADGYVYVADFDEDSLYRYDPASGEVVNLGVVGDGPQFLAANGSGQ